MRKIGLLCSIILLIMSYGCSSGSKAKGNVIDIITKRPISNVNIHATAKTDIQKDKKYENISTTTDTNGNFLLKGLSPKYTYTIRVQMAGYSIDSSSFSPPEKDQTKIIDKPFQITKTPNKHGVFLYSNGHFKEIQTTNLKKDSFAVNSHDSRPISTFYYLENLADLAERENTAVLINLPKVSDRYYVRNFSLFDELKTCTKASDRGQAKWEVKKQKNILIEGVERDSKDSKIIKFFSQWETGSTFENPSGDTGIGVTTLKGKIPSVKCTTPSGNMWIVFIQKLNNGYYTLSTDSSPNSENSKNKGERWVFAKSLNSSL